LLTVAGLHTPSIPFVDVRGKSGTALFIQIVSDEPKLKSGVIVGVIVTANVTVVAH
jgi:hypothetical protein